MTVNTIGITAGPYIGNGVASSFSYGFRVQNKNEILVYETSINGELETLTVDTDYTVNNIGEDDGGTVTRTAGALPTGAQWYMRSNYQMTQDTEFSSQGAFFPELHEDAMDKMTYLIQQLFDQINRGLRFPDSSSVGENGATLPDPEALKLLRWKSDLTGLENVSLSELDPGLVVLDDFITKVPTINSLYGLTDITADQIFYVSGETTPGSKASFYIVKVGSIAFNEPPVKMQSIVAGYHFERAGSALDFAENLTADNLDRSYLANVNNINYDKCIMLFGDSHGWGQGAPEGDNYGVAVDVSTHSASLFNLGFMARIEEYIKRKRGYDDKLHALTATPGTRVIVGDNNPGNSDPIVEPLHVISGRVISGSGDRVASGSSYKGFYSAIAGTDTSFVTYYRDKILKNRFGFGMSFIYPQTDSFFCENGNLEYINLLPIYPNVAATGGFSQVTDSNGTIIAEYNGSQFFIRVSSKMPLADFGFFTTNPQSHYIHGYGKFVSTSSSGIAGGSIVRVFAADGVSYPTGLEKFIFSGMKIFKGDFSSRTSMMALPKKPFRKMYIAVQAHSGGRKISIGLCNETIKGGVVWKRGGHLDGGSLELNLRPQWNWGRGSYPVVTIVSPSGDRVSAAASATIGAVGSGDGLIIDTYSAVSADIVYELDFGSKVHSEVFIDDFDVGSGGTSTHTRLRGILFDNNSVTNWSMGGHTVGQWMGDGASFNDPARDHLADILTYTSVNPYLAIVELPLVNEYLRQTPLATFKSNIALLISRVDGHLNGTGTRQTMFLFFTTLGTRGIEFEGAASAALTYQMYSDAAKEQCATSDVVFVDVRQVLKDKVATKMIDYELLYNDAIHPSGIANELMADHLLPIIDQML